MSQVVLFGMDGFKHRLHRWLWNKHRTQQHFSWPASRPFPQELTTLVPVGQGHKDFGVGVIAQENFAASATVSAPSCEQGGG